MKEVLGIADRITALNVGRALEAQRFFHDVNYENRLIDDITEVYQFNEVLFHHLNLPTISNSGSFYQSVTSAILNNYMTEDGGENEEDDISDTTSTSTATQRNNISLPNGVYTELTRCYSPTCSYRNPCYSYTCPKKERLVIALCFFFFFCKTLLNNQTANSLSKFRHT